ncbi:MAG TPA: site-2 protease family protein [Pyrinomonadaceae bacterium]|jgi:Zn-dependent protease
MNVIEFSRRQLLVAHVFDIPVRVDYRWFGVLILISVLTAVNIPAELIENFAVRLVLAFISTLVFFASILFHELAHAFTARREGVEVLEIVLHPFGGLARFRREPETPRAEFRIAIAGPFASFLLALAFLLLLWLSLSLQTDILTPPLTMLFFGNMLLAIFNLFPGYPLDGGRVLRAFLWRRGTDLNEATVITGRAGQIIAIAMITVGLYISFIRGEFFNGVWTVLVGLFLLDAATGIIKQTSRHENFPVEQAMTLPVAVAPDAGVLHFIDHILPLHRQSVFLVAKDRQLYGMLMLADLKKIPREDWHKKQILEIMRPVTTDYFVENTSTIAEARELLRANGIGALGVIDENGELVGFLQRGKIRKRS